MKKSSDYIISALPGLDVLNGHHISKLGKIYGSLFNNPYQKWFNNYSLSYNKLKIIFNKNILEKYYSEMLTSFEIALNKIDASNNLDKWDIFNITERQPNLSNMSDLVENDLFETLHPFCDIELAKTFLQVPTRMRMFQQLSKEMIYKYFPEVREIHYNLGRRIQKNHSLTLSIIYAIFSKLIKSESSSILWDHKKAFQKDITIIKNDLKRIFDYPSLLSFFNIEFLESIVKSELKIVDNFLLVEQILSFLYAYEMFINVNELTIPKELIQQYVN